MKIMFILGFFFAIVLAERHHRLVWAEFTQEAIQHCTKFGRSQ